MANTQLEQLSTDLGLQQPKVWYKSVGAVAGILTVGLSLYTAFTGIETSLYFNPDTIKAIADAFVNIVLAVTSAFALWGRLKAQGTIHLTQRKAEDAKPTIPQEVINQATGPNPLTDTLR